MGYLVEYSYDLNNKMDYAGFVEDNYTTVLCNLGLCQIYELYDHKTDCSMLNQPPD